MDTDSYQPVLTKHLLLSPQSSVITTEYTRNMIALRVILVVAALLALVALAAAFPSADPEAYADPAPHGWGYRRPSYSYSRPSYSSYRPSYSYGSYSRPSYSHHRW